MRWGLAEDTTPGAPLCRWRRDELIVDVMPLDEHVLGFSNRAGVGDAVLPTQVLHRQAGIGLPQESYDLRFREPLLHHQTLSLGRTLNEHATQIRGDVTRALQRDTTVR